ncbi:MAG: hypothetical protein R6V45_00625 [Oceanipulchritudo sp.]
MFFRKIGKFLRGKATPFQILSATVLGALLGSLPGFGQGPLLLVLLLFLLIVLNANLFLAALTLLFVKLVTLLLLPVYFKVGVYLLEGPLNGPVAALVNAPVTAWFGLETYVMLPSLLGGGALGIIIGVLISRALGSFRTKMASLETGSERYQAYTSKVWVKALAWIFVGGLKGKKSWAELGGKRRGLPVRPLGIVFILSLGVLVYIGLQFLDETIITSYTRDALESVNGATVDIDGVAIEAAQNRIVLSGLAMADPEALQTNRFAAKEIVTDISGMNLLAKKMVIDSIRVIEPESGTERRLRGRLTGPATEEPEPVEEPDEEPEEEIVSLEDYLGQAQKWRERLAMAKRVYDRIAPHLKKDEEEAPEEDRPGWRERLEARAEEAGYGALKSDSLIRGTPRLWIRDLMAENLEVGGDDRRFSISGSNLASQPALLEESGHLEILSEDDTMEVGLELPSSENPSRSVIEIRYSDLAVSELEEETGRDLPMEGGRIDIAGKGTIDGGILELPLTVTLRETTLKAFGSSLPLDELPLQVRIYGPLDSPLLSIPKDALEEAVKSGGKKKVEDLIKDKAGDSLKDIFPFGG